MNINCRTVIQTYMNADITIDIKMLDTNNIIDLFMP